LNKRRSQPSPDPRVQKDERHFELTELQALPAMFSLIMQIPIPLAVVVPSPIGNHMSELVCPVVHLKTRRQSAAASQEVANLERQREFAVVQGLLVTAVMQTPSQSQNARPL